MGTFFIGTPFVKGAGYFTNDNKASGGRHEEADVKTCPHCQSVILMQTWKRVEDGKMNGGWCVKCSAPICGHCNKAMQTQGCVPFVAMIDKMLDATVKLDQFRKLAGLDTPEPPREIFVPVSIRE